MEGGRMYQSGELGEQAEGLEDDVGRAARSHVVQLDGDAPVARPSDRVLGERGPKTVAKQSLASRTIVGRGGDARVGGEAAMGAGLGARASDVLEDGVDLAVAVDLREPGDDPPRGVVERRDDVGLGRRQERLGLDDAMRREPGEEAATGRPREGDELVFGRRPKGHEDERRGGGLVVFGDDLRREGAELGRGRGVVWARYATPRFVKDAVERDEVKVRVEIKSVARALEARDGAGERDADPAGASLSSLEAGDLRREDARKRGERGRVIADDGPQREGERGDELPKWLFGEDVLEEVLGELDHPPSAARGAEAAPVAGERNEHRVTTGDADQAQRALRGVTAVQVGLELPLNERGDVRRAGVEVLAGLEESAQVGTNDVSENAGRPVSRCVARRDVRGGLG
jgi:hypothetical protein